MAERQWPWTILAKLETSSEPDSRIAWRIRVGRRLGACSVKYMGSKRAMLRNGLGELIFSEAKGHDRLVDLFCGASSVTWFAAQKCSKPVFAVDLQAYAVILAGAVIRRTEPFRAEEFEKTWLQPATE